MPWLSYLSTAHIDDIAVRDSRKARDLIESEWWQERWGRGTESDVYLIRRGEDDFENNHRGTRKCMAFRALTGGRADRVLVDDPHSTEKAESELERLTAGRIFHESLHSRVNDPRRSAIIIIMQRLHKLDISGLALATPQGYVHVMLPLEFEPDRRCVTPIFADPRQVKNELLFEERFPADWLAREKGTMKAYGVAGQFQQRPDQREGNMFKRHWFKIVGAAPMGIRWVRYWDLAATEEKYSQASTAQTAGVLMGGGPSVGFYIADCIAEWVENPGPLIKNTGHLDRMKYFPYEVGAPQDPGAVGKLYKKSLALELAEFNCRFLKESGDKAMRAEPLASQAEAGNVYIVTNPNQPLPLWAEHFIDQACEFPGGALKDKVDAASGGYATLLKPSRQNMGGGRPIPQGLAAAVIGR
jgi:predicted phage terminase large subunit-like protein